MASVNQNTTYIAAPTSAPQGQGMQIQDVERNLSITAIVPSIEEGVKQEQTGTEDE